MSPKKTGGQLSGGIFTLLKRLAVILPTALICAAAVIYMTSLCALDVAVRLNINGTPVGYVKSDSTVTAAKAALLSKISGITDGKYNADFDISYDFIHTNAPEYMTESDVADILWSLVADDFCEAYMLYVDGHHAAAGESEAQLLELIDSIEKELFTRMGGSFENVKISSGITIEKQLCLKSELKTIDEINAIINPISHSEVSLQENAVPTSSPNGNTMMRVSAFSASAPSVDSSSYFDPNVDYGLSRVDGECEAYDLTLDYNFINTVTETETVYFETKYEPDYNDFIGNESLLTEGSNGEKEVTYELIYNEDGKLIAKNAISEKVITQVEHRVILQGAKEIPDSIPTGTFIWPCAAPQGISSYYGWRDLYGKPDFHLGIDIPDKYGSNIRASDGGTVVWAGRTPSYGYSIRVQHANNYVTVYAHLSEMLVSVGDNVYQGQIIGKMGKSGVAYGTHLHFEVRIGSTTVDPLKYLP